MKMRPRSVETRNTDMLPVRSFHSVNINMINVLVLIVPKKQIKPYNLNFYY